MNVKFSPLSFSKLNITQESVIWNEASLIFAVSDNLKGINEDLFVDWDSSRIVFNPQPTGFTGLPGAFAASVPLTAAESAKEHSIHLQFSLNGSEQLLFSTTARENKMQMRSTWSNPSFTGVRLPDTRTVNSEGFTADWKYMNRTVPQSWKDNFYDLTASVLGTNLMITVDNYNKTERSVKYALLCILLTFAAFFLVERIYKRTLHLAHYGLAGLALILFYSLLLSISEYTGFNLAYVIAGIATIGLVTWFIGSILRSVRLGFFIGFVLTVVYSYIFTIIQLQDYALLMGSIGLFIALAIIMYFSRKLQW
jgi:inner membrane protein